MKRPNSGEIFLALVLILIGALLLVSNLGWFAFNWNMVWPLVLIFFGVWLVGRAFQPTRFGGATYGLGDYRPDLAGREIRAENFSHGFGDFDLDLSRATIPDGASSVRASIGFGELKVIVPRDLAMRVHASAGLGDVSVLGQKDEGIAPIVNFQSDDYAAASRKLDLDVSVGLGEVKVVQAS